VNNQETNTTYTTRKKKSASSKKKVSTTSKKRDTLNRRLIQYVLPIGNGWVVKTNNAAKFTVVTDSKKEAIAIARNLAQTKHSDLIVHGKDGNIELKESYAI
jgi:hypothetical protein